MSRVEGGTRLRAVPAMALGFVCLGLLHALVSSSVLAVNFTTADQQFKIYSNYVQGVYGAGYLGKDTRYTAANQSGIAELGFKTALLSGFCAISHQTLPGGGTLSLMILAGAPVRPSFNNATLVTTDGAGQPIQLDSNGLLAGQSATDAVTVADMFMNTPLVGGYANKLSGLNLGQNATQVAAPAGLTWPTGGGGAQPVSGKFGLFAHHLNLAGFDGGAYGVNLAGSVHLPKMKMRVLTGTRTQADCPTQAATP